MKRLRPLGKTPAAASNVAPEVKVAFARDVLDAAVPLFEDKDPSNPLPTDSSS